MQILYEIINLHSAWMAEQCNVNVKKINNKKLLKTRKELIFQTEHYFPSISLSRMIIYELKYMQIHIHIIWVTGY